MHSKKNIVISIVVIFILAAYLIINKLVTKTVVKLPEIKGAITELVLKKGGAIILIKQVGDSWKVNEFDGDKNIIANMTNKIKDLKITDLVSDKPHYERYELDDDHAVRVQAKCNGQIVRDVYIGKKGSTYRHTYVRFEGDPKVYLAEDTLDSYFNKTVDELRNKDIVQLDIAKINLVKLWYKNTALTLQKIIVEKKKEESGKDAQKNTQEKPKEEVEKEEQWISKEYPHVTLDNDKVKEILFTFDPLKAYSFPDVDTRSLTGKIASVVVSVKKDDDPQRAEDITLTIHKEYENNRYLCTSSKSQYVFTLDEWRAKRLFKTLQDIKK